MGKVRGAAVGIILEQRVAQAEMLARVDIDAAHRRCAELTSLASIRFMWLARHVGYGAGACAPGEYRQTVRNFLCFFARFAVENGSTMRLCRQICLPTLAI